MSLDTRVDPLGGIFQEVSSRLFSGRVFQDLFSVVVYGGSLRTVLGSCWIVDATFPQAMLKVFVG